MKRFFLILFISVGLTSACEKAEEEKNVPLTVSNVLGKWQLSETYISQGGSAEWIAVEDGSIYTFDLNGMYKLANTMDDFFNQSGTYKVEGTILELTYQLGDETKVEGFNLEMTDTTITLSPAFPVICIEACLSRFKRLK